MTLEEGPNDAPAGLARPPLDGKRHRWRRDEEDVRKWVELFKSGVTIVPIARRFGVAPSTVSKEIHREGVVIIPGHHMVEQRPLRYSHQFVQLVDKGPDAVLKFVKSRVWGIKASPFGVKQLRRFCEFVELHQQGVGVKETAQRLSVHRSTVAEWREGTDQPYLTRAANDSLPLVPRADWKLLPMHLISGGNEPSGWIQVPLTIQSYNDVLNVIQQVQPRNETYELANNFAILHQQIQVLRPELFAYLLGMMVGDSAKLGGEQQRYASMHLDLQLTLGQETNAQLGEFVTLCVNSIGLEMTRIKDKSPSGRQLLGRNPIPAYRWSTERSPLLAWMFSVGLGLNWGETTTTNMLRMEWIFDMPESFRKRFIQGVADSDGCVKRYVVEIASVPNSEFITRVLRSLGMTSAHVAFEGGEPLKARLNRREASTLPVFSEYVKSYRFQKMMELNKPGPFPRSRHPLTGKENGQD
ncbi:MAG: hypothetical protein JRN21_03155 [Nitrososphaerota archaeon]|nr:hypothetical protein [Nitrososphaerota archaeon]